VPSPTAIHAELQRRAPEPPSIMLTAKERDALAAWRARRAAVRQRANVFRASDPYLVTWMP